MPKKAGMEKWKKKRRQEYLEMKQYRYYIFCEGQQTEQVRHQRRLRREQRCMSW